MTDTAIARADLLIANGRLQEAVVLVVNASASGDADAQFRQAIWRLSGQPLQRDLPGARALLRQARIAGHTDAALFEVALTANGSGAPADWRAAYDLLEVLAKTDLVAAKQVELLKKMKLTSHGDPIDMPDRERLGEAPDVWRIPALFSADECRHIAEGVVDILAPATVADPATGRNVANPVRTSDGAVVGPTRETLVIQALNRRLAAATDTDWRQGEALSVLRYRPGQQFRPHVDALPVTRNQRIRTVLVYLNDGYGGGATSFEHNRLRVEPHTGDAIIFDNVRADGSPDPTTKHAGEPVTHGVKWLATRWIRARSFDVWTGPESA